MSTKRKFGNKIIQLPGTYSRIVSGQNNPPRDLDYGKLLIIDNPDLNVSKSGTGMIGGAGVNGTLASGKNAIYTLNDIIEFRDFVGGNWWWKAAEGLFNPDGQNNGISQAKIIKPATTVPALMSFVATGGGPNGGTFKVKTRDESAEANGVTDETRAQSTVTVTGAGTTGDKITIKVGATTVAEYTNAASDSIAAMIAGLATNMVTRGICSVVSQVSPALVFKAPAGMGSSANGTSPTIQVTGTAAATAGVFSGGADSSQLVSGYGYTIETGSIDPSKWIFKLWRGTYKGLYTDNVPYDEVAQADAKVILIAASGEFNNMQELIAWAQQDAAFGMYFYLDPTSVVTGTGDILASDITSLKGYQPAAGGSATYDSLDDALEMITDQDYNYILTTCSTADPTTDPDILKIVDHITNDAKYDKYLIIAGHNTNLTSTINYAKQFGTEKVNVVHGGVKKASRLFASGFREWDSFFHTAWTVGRLLGLAPWVPLTFKSLDIDGVVDELSEKEKIAADAAGVLATVWDDDFGKFVNLHDVNTLQLSDFVLNDDGSSHLVQIEREKAQLNKELIINSKLTLMSDPQGVNRTSLSEEDAIEWTKTYLQRKLKTLIIDYRNVTAKTEEDVILVDYEASPNSEIKGLFFTGRLYL